MLYNNCDNLSNERFDMGVPKRITPSNRKFIQNIIDGMSQIDAYIDAYPNNKKSNRKTVTIRAYQVFQKPHIQEEYQRLLKDLQERQQIKSQWKREQSVEALQFVIQCNRKDMERVQKASEEELELLQKIMQEKPEEAQDVLAMMISQKKKARSYKTNNDGIISAVSELNKMHGYNEQNINMNGTVVFTDDDKLEE